MFFSHFHPPPLSVQASQSECDMCWHPSQDAIYAGIPIRMRYMLASQPGCDMCRQVCSGEEVERSVTEPPRMPAIECYKIMHSSGMRYEAR